MKEEILKIIDSEIAFRKDKKNKSLSFYFPAQIEVLNDIRLKVSRVELPVILQLVEMLDETIKTQTEHLATAYVKNNENLYNKLSYRLEAFEQIKLWVNNKLSK